MNHFLSTLRRAGSAHPPLALAALLLCAGLTEAHIHARAPAPPPTTVMAQVFAAAVPVELPLPQPKPMRRLAGDWHVNERALDIIRHAEGLRLTSYRLAGQWLIGYGHAIIEARDPAALTITRARADALLRGDVERCEAAVSRTVEVRVTRNQFSALVAFCYNIGEGAFARSDILRYVNGGHAQEAADALLHWNHADIGGNEIEVTPLSIRRARERALFLSAIAPATGVRADLA